MKLFKYIITVLFVISCDKDSPYISNDIDSIEYEADLKSLNSGQNKYSSDVHWNKYTGDDVLYEISDDNGNIIETITSKNDTTLSLSMNLNEIKVISLSVNATDYGDIKIFSRPIILTTFPITTSESRYCTSIASLCCSSISTNCRVSLI